MTDREIIDMYRPLVDMIAEFLGDECEVVLHDLSKPDESVIAIRNGNLSGRTVGCPTTNLGLRRLMEDSQSQKSDIISNYIAISPTGCVFKSSSLMIRNQHNSIIGSLCINLKIDNLIKAKSALERICATSAGENGGLSPVYTEYTAIASLPQENLQHKVSSIVESAVLEALGNLDLTTSALTQKDKKIIVSKLYENGIFVFKGGVTEVARLLEMSEPTLYRYLSKIKAVRAD